MRPSVVHTCTELISVLLGFSMSLLTQHGATNNLVLPRTYRATKRQEGVLASVPRLLTESLVHIACACTNYVQIWHVCVHRISNSVYITCIAYNA